MFVPLVFFLFRIHFKKEVTIALHRVVWSACGSQNQYAGPGDGLSVCLWDKMGLHSAWCVWGVWRSLEKFTTCIEAVVDSLSLLPLLFNLISCIPPPPTHMHQFEINNTSFDDEWFWNKKHYVHSVASASGAVCANKNTDCEGYGQSICTGEYADWARSNCAKLCGYCTGKRQCILPLRLLLFAAFFLFFLFHFDLPWYNRAGCLEQLPLSVFRSVEAGYSFTLHVF